MSPPSAPGNSKLVGMTLTLFGIIILTVFILIYSFGQYRNCEKAQCPAGSVPVMAQSGQCICAIPAKVP